MNANDDTDERLIRLGRATEGIAPRPGFSARVMGSLVAESRSGWLDTVRVASRRVLPAAALAAVVALALAARSQASLDETLAASYGMVDVDGD